MGISQSASTFGLATTSIAAPAAGGDYWIGVNATPGLGYSISNQSNQGIASVITLNPSSGFTIRVNQNTGAARSATITATSTGGGHSGTVTVSQAAGGYIIGGVELLPHQPGNGTYYTATSSCASQGGRLPTISELNAFMAKNNELPSSLKFYNAEYWSSDISNGSGKVDWRYTLVFPSLELRDIGKDFPLISIRCVRNI